MGKRRKVKKSRKHDSLQKMLVLAAAIDLISKVIELINHLLER